MHSVSLGCKVSSHPFNSKVVSHLVRKDRLVGRGGGVQIYVRESIPCKLRLDVSNDQYECLWIVSRPIWLPRSISRIAMDLSPYN